MQARRGTGASAYLTEEKKNGRQRRPINDQGSFRHEGAFFLLPSAG
ncbi:MAG: hypothetical protein H7Z75_15565 [Ferruginibacter sp.]|nr:hypothetical protein [Cytophagales bacterium]